ncbi:MAG: histidine phosphatase family protein [Aquabacterium sp.]
MTPAFEPSARSLAQGLSAWVMAWRHPQPMGAAGRCIGRTDLPVDRRKARRLAHRIRQAARRHGWPRVVHTSSLQRCALVGRQLRRWGWQHVVDDDLIEASFGAWDGRPWAQIPWGEVDAWCADFAGHAPGGGECLRDVMARVAAWPEAEASPTGLPAPPRLVVAHAGWMLARRWLLTHPDLPARAADWPRPPAYGTCWSLGPSLAASSP